MVGLRAVAKCGVTTTLFAEQSANLTFPEIAWLKERWPRPRGDGGRHVLLGRARAPDRPGRRRSAERRVDGARRIRTVSGGGMMAAVTRAGLNRSPSIEGLEAAGQIPLAKLIFDLLS